MRHRAGEFKHHFGRWQTVILAADQSGASESQRIEGGLQLFIEILVNVVSFTDTVEMRRSGKEPVGMSRLIGCGFVRQYRHVPPPQGGSRHRWIHQKIGFQDITQEILLAPFIGVILTGHNQYYFAVALDLAFHPQFVQSLPAVDLFGPGQESEPFCYLLYLPAGIRVFIGNVDAPGRHSHG